MEKSEFERKMLRVWGTYESAFEIFTRTFYAPDQFTPELHASFEKFREADALRWCMMWFQEHMLEGRERFREPRSEKAEFVDGITADGDWIGWDYPQASKPVGRSAIAGEAFKVKLHYCQKLIQADDWSTAPVTLYKIELSCAPSQSGCVKPARDRRRDILQYLSNVLGEPLLDRRDRLAWVTAMGWIECQHALHFDEEEDEAEHFSVSIVIHRAYDYHKDYLQQLGGILQSFSK